MALLVIFKQIDREKSEKILDKTYRYASYNSFTFHCLLFAQGWLSKSGGIPQVVLGLPGSGCGTLASVLGAAPNTEAVDCNELLDKDWSRLIFSRFRNLEKLSVTRRLELQFLVMRLKARRPHSDVSQQDAVQIVKLVTRSWNDAQRWVWPCTTCWPRDRCIAHVHLSFACPQCHA